MTRYLEKVRGYCEELMCFDWQFALTDSHDHPAVDTAWRTVQLPHDWSIDYPVHPDAPSCGSGGYARTGIGWYRHDFAVSCCADERVVLCFEGVMMNCDIWLNDQHIGAHVYGYTPFEVEITEALQDGKNELLVRVDHSHQPGSRWYTGSGIIRDVWIIRTKKAYIRTGGIYITTPVVTDEHSVVQVQTEVNGLFGLADISLHTHIEDDTGHICSEDCAVLRPGSAECVTQQLTVVSPTRWDLASPYLYTMVCRLMIGDQILHEKRTSFGIRTIAFSGENGFLLNNQKVILQGVCLHHDGGCVGAAVPKAIWQRRLQKLKAMGANAIRCSHNPPDTALLDLADEMGFVVMDEAFDEWRYMKQKVYGSNTHESRGYSEWFDACWQQDLTAMIERDRNHPSVIMWSIGNEVPEQSLPDGMDIAARLAGMCHALDPSRPVTQACDQMKAEPAPATEAFLEQLDIVGVNYADRWRERTETFFDEEKREHPHWLLLGTEDCAVSGARGDYSLQTPESVWGRTPYHAKMLKPEKLWKFIRTRPYMLGSFMWTGVDYLGESFWPHKSSTAGVLDTCCFEKDGYYFYQSLWVKDKPVLYLCPQLNLDLEPGDIMPMIAYTNCFTVELFVDGKSYGEKAYEFPAKGMTQYWGHFDGKLSPITTNDLHLSWDIPYTRGEVIAIGRDEQGHEIARCQLRPAGEPASLEVKCDRHELMADGRDVAQIEIILRDSDGRVVPHRDLPVTLSIEGGTLLGMDNGRSDDPTPYTAGGRDTFHGLCYAVIRAPRCAGPVRMTVSAPGLPPVKHELLAR